MEHNNERQSATVLHEADEDQVEYRAISTREVFYAVAGVLVGLLILATVWWRAGRNTAPLPMLTEVAPYAAPTFQARDVNGTPINLSQFAGNVVLLNFWATWCVPCKDETPELQAAYQQFRAEGLVIVGIDLFKTERGGEAGRADVRQFVDRFGVSYPIVLDESGSIAKAYAIAPIPTSYFIDQQGRVRFIRVGKLNKQDVERVFRRLQAESGAPNG